jgi:hypothetical protein
MPMAPIVVAGQPISDPLQKITDYIGDHERTIKRFDLVAGTSPNGLTSELITATRFLSSRITKKEEAWLLEIEADAPWDSVSPTDSFVGADVLEVGGLYDHASVLWEYFWQIRPDKFAHAKLSKTLFLMRPRFFPIVDSHIAKKYRSQARALRPTVYAARPSLVGKDRLTWEAMRRDMIVALPELQHIRERLHNASLLHQSVATHVSDLRLFDMLVW